MEPLFYEMDLEVTRDRVWEVLTAPQELHRWLGPKTEVEIALGGRFDLCFRGDEEKSADDFALSGRVFSLDRPRLLQVGGPDSKNPFDLTIRLFPTLTGTRLELVHSGFGSGADAEQSRQDFDRAWMSALERLRAVTRL